MGDERRRTIARAVAAAVVLGAAAWAAPHRDAVAIERLQAHVDALGPWGPLAFAGAYAVATVLFVPGSALTLAGGALFGPLLGGLASLTGATVGATVSLVLSRYVVGEWARRRAGPRLQALLEGVDRRGWRFVAFVRLVPLLPFNALNYALGLTRIAVLPYATTSLVCMAPGALVYAYLGHAGRAIAGGAPDALRHALLAASALLALLLLPGLVRRRAPEPDPCPR